MNKTIVFLMMALLSIKSIQATAPKQEVAIIGGGIIGALESYAAFQEAQKENVQVCVTVYDKSEPFTVSTGGALTNTAYNIVPSLTIDEILSVVPRGNELMQKLAIPFDSPGGIRVDDVAGVNDSPVAMHFKQAVALYGQDKNHDDRTETLLQLGKMSMDLWQQMYDSGDAELKMILEESNFNPCHEPKNEQSRVLHDGYRIDLIYGVSDAKTRALNMQADYLKYGYKKCAILSPDEVAATDPFLADFCKTHSTVSKDGKRLWADDSVAIFRPGGCIDMRIFLPKFYTYLKKIMGQYKDSSGQLQDCFNLKFKNEVAAVEFTNDSENVSIAGLKFSDGSFVRNKDCKYVFCPGEAIGTLDRLGFNEPAYAAFAGPSLFLTIPISPEQAIMYKNFSHCMEVHKVGIVLAWQARLIQNSIFIGVAGTKAFYGDKAPEKNEAFAKNRNLVQLNMINTVLPEFISLAMGRNTYGTELSSDDLLFLEQKGVAKRWVGRRAVAYDGFPTFGFLYHNNQKVQNGRCTTHLGSGGVSFSQAAVFVSRQAEKSSDDVFIKKVLTYSDSQRQAERN